MSRPRPCTASKLSIAVEVDAVMQQAHCHGASLPAHVVSFQAVQIRCCCSMLPACPDRASGQLHVQAHQAAHAAAGGSQTLPGVGAPVGRDAPDYQLRQPIVQQVEVGGAWGHAHKAQGRAPGCCGWASRKITATRRLHGHHGPHAGPVDRTQTNPNPGMRCRKDGLQPHLYAVCAQQVPLDARSLLSVCLRVVHVAENRYLHTSCSRVGDLAVSPSATCRNIVWQHRPSTGPRCKLCWSSALQAIHTHPSFPCHDGMHILQQNCRVFDVA